MSKQYCSLDRLVSLFKSDEPVGFFLIRFEVMVNDISGFRLNVVCAVTIVFLFMGCGGPANVAEVTGTVTLDGRPLAGATVTFVPVDSSGVLSRGITDSEGKYKLVYDANYTGAAIGDYQVSISTFRGGFPDDDPPRPKVLEQLPTKYNFSTELKTTVVGGVNQIDFPLDSKGKIIQPDSKEAEGRSALFLPC